MKLCEHIAGIYRNEIEHGNEPVFVCTPNYNNSSETKSNMTVIMKNKLLDYDIEGIEVVYLNDTHYPLERSYHCTACNQYIVGPQKEGQRGWYEYSRYNKVNEKVVATRENVCTEDIGCGQLMVPKKVLSDVSEINE